MTISYHDTLSADSVSGGPCDPGPEVERSSFWSDALYDSPTAAHAVGTVYIYQGGKMGNKASVLCGHVPSLGLPGATASPKHQLGDVLAPTSSCRDEHRHFPANGDTPGARDGSFSMPCTTSTARTTPRPTFLTVPFESRHQGTTSGGQRGHRGAVAQSLHGGEL